MKVPLIIVFMLLAASGTWAQSSKGCGNYHRTVKEPYGSGIKIETTYFQKCRLWSRSTKYFTDTVTVGVQPYRSENLFYRKNGKKSRLVENSDNQASQDTHYTKKGGVRVKRIYTVNAQGLLVDIETVRKGKSRHLVFFDSDGNPTLATKFSRFWFRMTHFR